METHPQLKWEGRVFKKEFFSTPFLFYYLHPRSYPGTTAGGPAVRGLTRPPHENGVGGGTSWWMVDGATGAREKKGIGGGSGHCERIRRGGVASRWW